MTGAEAAQKLEALAALVRGRADCSPAELVALLSMALGVSAAPAPAPAPELPREARARGGMSNAEKCRRYRQRCRDTEPTPVATPPTPTPRPTPTGVATPTATPTATPKPTPPTPVGPSPAPLPFRSEDDENEEEKSSSSIRETRARDTGVATPKPTPRPVSRLSNREEAEALPIGERARYVLKNPYDAEWLEPHRWSELLQLAEALATANGDPKPRLLRMSSDKAVVHMLELFAADYPLEDLLYVFSSVPRQTWWRSDRGRLGLTSVTSEVVRRTLAMRRERDAEQAKVDELVALAARPRPPARAAAPLGSLLAGVMPDPEDEVSDAAR
jgi:hypothetical protein